MRTELITTFAIVLISACGDSSSVVTTVITTAGSDTSTPEPSSDTDEETTETSTSTGIAEPTTTDSSDTVDLTTSTTDVDPTNPADPPEYCIENEDGETSAPITCTPVADTWCDEVEAFAGEHLPETYAQIAVLNCEATGRLDPCSVCFYIANTQCQVSGPCDDSLLYECGCLARAHGMI